MRTTKLTLIASALAITVAGASSAAFAKPPHAGGKHKGNQQAERVERNDDGSVNWDNIGDRAIERILTATEKERIREYFDDEDNHVGAKGLPPGIAKNLKRGKPLPPGIAKRGVPEDLERQLITREGIKPIIAGDSVVLEDLATGILIDILRDVVR